MARRETVAPLLAWPNGSSMIVRRERLCYTWLSKQPHGEFRAYTGGVAWPRGADAMRGRSERYQQWDDGQGYADDGESYGYGEQNYSDADYGQYGQYGEYDDDAMYAQDDAQGLVLQREQSLVGVSSTVTSHGVPLLSYTRTMNRFYSSRKQKLSLYRFKCEVCGERIRGWAWQTPTGNRTHDGCYERLAWMWTNLYAQQQRAAN